MRFLYFLVMMFMSSVSLKPKFCVDCKYFIPCETTNLVQYGKCSLSKYDIDKNDENFLVSGIQVPLITQYRYCSTMRNYEDFCGKEGKKYKKKYKKRNV